MSLRPLLIFGIAVVVLSSCNTDLDITAPYKENTIVYALLDKDSAVQYVRRSLGLKVCAIATLADLLLYLSDSRGAGMLQHREQVLAYRQRYGVGEG